MTPALPYICFISGIGAFYLYQFFPMAALFLFSLLIAALYKNNGRHAFIYAAIVLVAFSYAQGRYDPAGTEADGSRITHSFKTRQPQPFSGVVSGLPVTTERGYIQEIQLRYPETRQKTFLSADRPLIPGSLLQGFAYMSTKGPRINPGSRNREPVMFLKTDGTLLLSRDDSIQWLPQRMRWRLYNYFRSNFSPDAASLLSAIVIGHRENSSNMLYAAYARTGLAHLMSISGTHFALFTLLTFFLIRYSARWLPYRWLVRLTARLSLDEIAALLTFPLILLYLLLSGGRIPAMRSFLMINIFLLGLLIGRKGQWLNSLLLAAAVILFLDPQSLKTISFQLSFLAVFFIGITLESFEGHVQQERFKPALQKFMRLILVTAGALIGTSPLVLYYFHTISTISMPANLIFTPVICFSILPAGVFGGMFYLVTGYFPLNGMLQVMVDIVNSSVSYISGIGNTTLFIGAFPAITLFFIYPAIYFALGKRWRWFILSTTALAATVILTFVSLDRTLPKVTFLDVAQGDAAVIESSDGRTIVVDTGYTGREVKDFLRYKGINEVDALVITHADKDHSGGLWNLLRSTTVKEVWDNGLLRYSPQLGEEILHREIEAGDILTSGESGFLALHPRKGYYTISAAEDNNYSLVLRFQDRDLKVMFTGDIEADAEESLVELKKYLPGDVLKVAHHGSKTSSTRDFLDSVNPKAAIISVGAGNTYGHPHRAALQRLSGFNLFRTDLSGAIRVEKDPLKGLVVKRFMDYRLKRAPGPGAPEEIDNLKRLILLW
ncbi:DNA internalization-related competence protein ComEC/Rec2 [hydrothermal vent metagenome]|uniref:DNA internalization-related competence protein ComEC/Rec2 n=1 Tax=hydrothermal vent metagenome TaxID=652676 RepID=A0A3B1CUJ1_9ZZZZ